MAKALSLALLGAVAFLAPNPDLGAQGKDKGPEKAKGVEQAPAPEPLDGTRPRNLVRDGYTRPGKPETKKDANEFGVLFAFFVILYGWPILTRSDCL